MYSSKLQSSAVAYKYGISGPWWYGGGATVQVLLFAQVSAPKFSFTLRNLTTFVGPARGQAQAQCPYAHTWPEIVYARWGRTAHFVFMFFGSVGFTVLDNYR